jgi:hypothetical protein
MPPPIQRLPVRLSTQATPQAQVLQTPEAPSPRHDPSVPVAVAAPPGRAPARPSQPPGSAAVPTELLSILASGLSLEHRDAVRQAYLGIVPIDAGRQKNTLAALDAVLRGAPDCGRAPADPRRTPRTHDNRQAQAIEIVAKRVPELLDWPEGTALELMDMGSVTPEIPVVGTSNAFDEHHVFRLWRSGESYFSGRALGESTPAPRSGIDGFFDALEQEMRLGGFSEGSDSHGIGPLRVAFAAALSPVPAPIEPSAPLALPDASALAPPDPAAQEGLGILADWIETGNWASEAGDLVPQVCTLLPGWPADRALVVHHGGLFPSVFGTTREGRMSVEIHRENNHYSALVDGERVDVPGDGDCFFHATIMALGKKDAQALTLDADREVQVFDQVFFGLSEEASYHIHIASRISSADQPGGGASIARMAQALTQLLGVLAHRLECAEGSDARRRMRRDLLLPYPQQVSVLDKLHYRKYEDFFSRAVLAGGVRNLHHASLIAARGLSQAWLLPGLDDGLRSRAASFAVLPASSWPITSRSRRLSVNRRDAWLGAAVSCAATALRPCAAVASASKAACASISAKSGGPKSGCARLR